MPFKKKDIVKWSSGLLKEVKGNCDFSLHIIGQDKMRALNNKYRAINYPTDVLSFRASKMIIFKNTCDRTDLGDIFICGPILKKQAHAYKISEKQEFLRLMSHGFLHLLGHTHQLRSQANKMFARQERIVNKLMKL